MTVQSSFTGIPVACRMKMCVSPLALVLAVAIATGSAATVPPVRAEEGQQQPTTLGPSVSLDEAVKMAEQRFKARVVRAEAQQDSGHTIYVLRMLNESGRVWTVRVDASNGSVL
jgi:uncharacterized membrane protein YkoI